MKRHEPEGFWKNKGACQRRGRAAINVFFPGVQPGGSSVCGDLTNFGRLKRMGQTPCKMLGSIDHLVDLI